MRKLIATLVLITTTFTTAPALAQNSIVGRCPPWIQSEQCVLSDCRPMGSGQGTVCNSAVPLATPLSATAPVVTPPAVFAQPGATMAPTSAPVQQVASAVPNCVGNACVDPDAGKFCGIHWCVWLIGGAILFGLGLLYLIMSRIELATAYGDYRARVAHWNLLVDCDGKPLPDVARSALIETANRIEEAWAEINRINWPRRLRIQANGQTYRPDHVAPRGLPPTAGAGAAGTTP